MTTRTRICSRCKFPKPETTKNYYQRKNANGRLSFGSTCKVCKRIRPKSTKPAMQKPIAPTNAAPRPLIKNCPDCGGMPWRVPGIRCKCGRRHAAEAPVQLVTHRHFERAV